MSFEVNRPLMPSVPPSAPIAPPPPPAEVQATPETPPVAPAEAPQAPAANPDTPQETNPVVEAEADIGAALESYKPGGWTFSAFRKSGVLPNYYDGGAKNGLGLAGMYQFGEKSPLSAFSAGGYLGFTEKSYAKNGVDKQAQSFDLGLQTKLAACKTYLNQSETLMFKAGPMLDATMSVDLNGGGIGADVLPGMYMTLASKDGWGVTAYAQQGLMGNQPLFLGAKFEVKLPW